MARYRIIKTNHTFESECCPGKYLTLYKAQKQLSETEWKTIFEACSLNQESAVEILRKNVIDMVNQNTIDKIVWFLNSDLGVEYQVYLDEEDEDEDALDEYLSIPEGEL